MRWKQIVATTVLIFSFLFVAGTYLFHELPVSISIQELNGKSTALKIKRREAKTLRSFLKRVLIWDPFGYTLIGCKPVSFSCYQNPFSSFTSLFPRNLDMYLGWQYFQKNLDKFCSPSLVFLDEKNPWVKNYTLIIVLDRNQILSTLNENNDLFDKHAPNFSIDLENINKRTFFQDTLKNNDILIGIVLGFGRENAQYYDLNKSKKRKSALKNQTDQKRNDLEKAVKKLWLKRLTLQEIPISDILIPGFIEKPDDDTVSKQFIKKRKIIIRYFQGKDLLEASLSLIKNGPAILEGQNDFD